MASAHPTLHNRIDLVNIPFTDRSSRILLFRQGNTLLIRLAERWVKYEAEFGSYRSRPAIIQHFTILESQSSPLAFNVETDPHLVSLRTAVGDFEWAFPDPETLMVGLPPGRYAIRFEVQADSVQIDRRGGVLRGKRNTAYTTNARILQNTVSPLDGGYLCVELMLEAEEGDALLLNVTPRLGFNRSVPSPKAVIAEAYERWDKWFAAAPPVLDEYRAQYEYAWWVMRAGLLSQRYYFTREALAPSKIHYVGAWQWDQFFHAIAYRHVDMKLAEDQIRIVVDHQQANGMFPDAVHDEGLITRLTRPVEQDVTKPPLIAWTALKLFEKSGHRDFLEEVYEPVIRWQNWWVNENHDESSGLCLYRHPFSSGLDDSPLWDEGMPVVAPDLNTYLSIQQESLARIADLIGDSEGAEHFRLGVEQWTIRMLNTLWDEHRGVFTALHDGQPIPVLTPFALLPMWTGYLPSAVTERLLAHLTNRAEFWGEWPIPTVALNDPKFDPNTMWRGPTWPNVNYLFVEALTRLGQHDLARKLRRKTLKLLMQHPDIYEYYNPLNADRPPKAAPIFGWSSAVFIDLAIQETELVQAGADR